MRTLYIDCTSGVSKDIFLGALVDLLGDPSVVKAIDIPGAHVTAETLEGGLHIGISCDGDSADRFSIADVGAVIDSLDILPAAKTYAHGVYRLIAESEAKVHKADVKDVHFHEVGRPSTVLFVAGACMAIGMLKPDRIVSTPIRTGIGQVSCAHGVLPIPAPATAGLLKKKETFPGDVEGEFCTPTGAALVGYFAGGFEDFPETGTVGCGTAPCGYGIPFRCRVAVRDDEY